MKGDVKEKISAMMDDESQDSSRLIDFIHSNTKAKVYWRDLHLARDFSHDLNCRLVGRDFSNLIAAAIEDEETYSTVTDVVQDNFHKKSKIQIWIKPMMGLAIAASIIAMSVLGLHFMRTESLDSQIQPVELMISTESPQRKQSPTSDFKHVSNLGTYWMVDNERIQDSITENRLNAYLTNHLEFSSMRNVGGVLPYSRLVGYDEPVK